MDAGLFSVGMSIYISTKQLDRPPNQSPEPTAVGRCGSIGNVLYAASRSYAVAQLLTLGCLCATPLFIAYILFAAALIGCTKHTDTHMSSPPIHWPPLTDYPSVSGRAATTNDVAANRAVFVLESAGQVIGHPLDIKIPQYAFHIDEQTHKRTPCIIIQAEEARGQQIIGGRMLPDGRVLWAAPFRRRRLEFLGDTQPPKSE